VANAELDLEMAMTDDETQKLQEQQASYTWRALRTVATTQLNKFEKITEKQTLESVLRDGGAAQGPNGGNEEAQDAEGVEGTTTADNGEGGAHSEAAPEQAKVTSEPTT
jgi:hypothetical protein